ncbi:MAG: arsenate reductase ArsC [Candidatus Marinimicrobia bacterium]|nr:arsenate reductase ArsC [Candidatus Neomarinimicrobiota bacterium]
MKKNLIFICTGNAVRSQMAHAYFNHFTNFRHDVVSAGVSPAGVHPMTQKVMHEDNISLAGHSSNHVSEYLDIEFDYIIVLCEVACLMLPKFKGNFQFLKWFLDDPIRIIGQKRKENGFRMTRDIIKSKILDFIDQEGL